MIRILVVLLLFSPSIFADQLANLVLYQYDKGNYVETANLLQQLKQQDPNRYKSLPFGLLHAKALLLANNKSAAVEVYKTLTSEARYIPFSLLPAARTEAAEGKFLSAIRYYQTYLRHRTLPDYTAVALEALNLCVLHTNAKELMETAKIVESGSSRIGKLYKAKALRMQGQTNEARTLLLSLIRVTKKDDVTSQALTELDTLEGPTLSAEERFQRGKLAYGVWNFDLTRKYLQPLLTYRIEAAYYYGRTLFFLGDYNGAKKAFELAITKWPNDSTAKLCLYNYANVFLRQGDYAKAAELFQQVRNKLSAELQQDTTSKLIQAWRAQGRYNDALHALQAEANSRNASRQGHSLYLRGRIYFQMGRHKDAYNDFHRASQLKSFTKNKEIKFWKATTLEKMNRQNEALTLYRALASEADYYGFKAQEKLARAPSAAQASSGSKNKNSSFRLCKLPDLSKEQEVRARFDAGDILPALLFLHLYEEAAQLLPSVTEQTWQLLGIDSRNKQQRYLGIIQLAVLGKNFSAATYYAEIFQKSLPKTFPVLSLPDEILKVVFPLPYREEIQKFSKQTNVDPFVVLAIMKQESKFKRFARSPAFARGLMQLIPSTAMSMATAVGVKDFSLEQLYRPDVNIQLGTRYLQEIAKEFGGELEKIAAGYNSGESNVRRWIAASTPGEILDFFSTIDLSETKKYVMIVKTNYEIYKRIYGTL